MIDVEAMTLKAGSTARFHAVGATNAAETMKLPPVDVPWGGERLPSETCRDSSGLAS